MENVTIVYTVDEWNTDLAEHLIPNNVILSLYIFLGIFGNLLVILVYRIRLKRMSDERFFIPVLAASDLLASVFCGSIAISWNMMQAKFTNGDLCKFMWFFGTFTTCWSIMQLEFIAIHRYIKVCRSTGQQLTLFWKRISVACSISIAIILAIPTIFLYGAVDFRNSKKDIVGKRCSKLHDGSKIISLVYNIVLGVLMLVIITSLFFLYGKIGWTIYRHLSNMKRGRYKNSSKSEESGLTNESFIIDSRDARVYQSANIQLSSKGESIDDSPQSTVVCSGNQVKDKIKPNNSEKDKRDRKLMNRFNLMFMIITIVFLVSFTPKVVLFILEGLNKNFWEHFSDSDRSAVLFVYRTYTINNIINPFIYAFMDTKFRNELKTMLKCRNEN